MHKHPSQRSLINAKIAQMLKWPKSQCLVLTAARQEFALLSGDQEFESWCCHFRSQYSKLAMFLGWKRWHTFLSPVSRCNTSQSWLSVLMYAEEGSWRFPVKLSCDATVQEDVEMRVMYLGGSMWVGYSKWPNLGENRVTVLSLGILFLPAGENHLCVLH